MERLTHMISEPVPLAQEDMGKLFTGSFRSHVPAERLRAQHHRIARLAAAGLRTFEIAEKTKYTPHRVGVLLNSPAMRELIAHYTELVNASFEREMDEFHNRSIRNMQVAEDLIGDRLERAEEEGIDLPLRDLIAISADRADRHGYPKRQINDNRNTNWAEMLEKMNERVKEKTVDAIPTP